MMTPAGMPQDGAAKKQVDPEVRMARRERRETYARLVASRVNNALTTQTPFLERLVHFWANLFAVSAQKQTTLGFAGLMEMEAIRPHVTGRFGDMLLAVERHPAMLFYLDKRNRSAPMPARPCAAAAAIIAASTKIWRARYWNCTPWRADRLRRPMLHRIRRALTGWTVAGMRAGRARALPGRSGRLAFVDVLHAPARGRSWAASSPGGGRRRAARARHAGVHPARRAMSRPSWRGILPRCPAAAMVARIEQGSSGVGALPTVYRALINSPRAWDPASSVPLPWD